MTFFLLSLYLLHHQQVQKIVINFSICGKSSSFNTSINKFQNLNKFCKLLCKIYCSIFLEFGAKKKYLYKFFFLYTIYKTKPPKKSLLNHYNRHLKKITKKNNLKLNQQFLFLSFDLLILIKFLLF